jgi:hypothetical protein
MCHDSSHVWDLVPAHLVIMFVPGSWCPETRVWQHGRDLSLSMGAATSWGEGARAATPCTWGASSIKGGEVSVIGKNRGWGGMCCERECGGRRWRGERDGMGLVTARVGEGENLTCVREETHIYRGKILGWVWSCLGEKKSSLLIREAKDCLKEKERGSS